jgi:uncharacterized protein (TIGR02996 family)
MTPDPDRIAFLRAIAANPDEDTPRLAYADWLDENGSTEADRARAEFIRLSCRPRLMARITKVEQRWLAAHWRHLLPSVSEQFSESGSKPDECQWSGRHFQMLRHVDGFREFISVDLEFWRGFVRRAAYDHAFEWMGAAVASDEPLTRHEHASPIYSSRIGDDQWTWAVIIHPDECGGSEVIDLIEGHSRVLVHPNATLKQFLPSGSDNLIKRVRKAVADAMTRRARQLAWLPEDLPTLA